MSEHGNRSGHRDHLWVLLIIAACALLEVWASWLGIGAVAGFPKLGRMTTGWILPVSTEAYWGYAVWAWLAGSAGRRSRRFAMGTAFGMFALSLGGQESGHLLAAAHRTAPAYVVGFVTALPLIAVGLIAILIHLRQADREEAAQAGRRDGMGAELEAERAAHEADVSALREELDAERSAHETAQREAAEALARAEKLAAKLGTVSAPKTRKETRKNAQPVSNGSAQGDDLTTELRALMELKADPSLRQPRMGGELARRLGVSPATGRRLHSRLTANGELAEPLSERSADDPDARSGERS